MRGMRGEDEIGDVERGIEEVRDEVVESLDELLRFVGELPGSRRAKRESGKGGSEDGGRVVRVDSRRWGRR